MRKLEERILKDGVVLPGEVLKVGAFLNQLIDTALLKEMADEVYSLFSESKITKILTIESSGLPFATAIAMKFGVPMTFAKKHASANMTDDVLSAEVYSYTHKKSFKIVVGKEYVRPGDRVLIADDFLANGNAIKGLVSIVESAGATVEGAAIEIEKSYQGAGDEIRKKAVRIESLARIASMENGKITFVS